LQIIAVENASGDDSASVLQAGLRPDESLLIAKENGGYTAGNNLGVAAALAGGAEYVLVLNPDVVVVNPDFVSTLVDYMEQNPRTGAVGPRVFLRQQGNVQNTVLRFPWLWRRAVDWVRIRMLGARLRSRERVVPAEALNGVCVLFRSVCLREVGLFDERTFAYIEDVDWAYRAQQRGWGRTYVPVDSIVHLQKESGYQRGGAVDYLLKRNTLYFLLKSRHWLQAAGYTIATMAMAGAHLLRSGSFGWTRRLAGAYFALWTARWHACMGRP
jgi:GT2 family glycosyltransferase